ncbi:MAG TPA: ROK family transcriptional regulator [Devosia sp.]|nr:ROK family transcriptional regulator [Devosia sp.]
MSSARAEINQRLSAGLSRGTNQSGVRLYNERLVLSLIRRHGELPKADIARMTRLSPQTISIIMNQLEADGLLRRGNAVRGRVGQPSVPYSLDPDGAFFLGLKIGRRSSDVVLLDFLGRVLSRIHEPHPCPTPQSTIALARRGVSELAGALPERQRRRVAGFGIASPFELWNWQSQFAAPPDVLDAWRHADIRADVAAVSPWPVYLHNDGTAACSAELVLGQSAHGPDFLYIFIGSFIGGGVVLNGHLFPGRTGYSGAIGPLPVRAADGGFQQILRSTSIYVLADKLKLAGIDPKVLWTDPDDWGDLGAPLAEWVADAAQDIAQAIVSALSIIEFGSIVIDGAFPRSVRATLVAAIRAAVAQFDLQGLPPINVVEGTMGSGAREIGGACLPLLANFTQDREVLFKENG